MTTVVTIDLNRGTVLHTKKSTERHRDVLFGAGCGLLCFGLFPFRTLSTRVDTSSNPYVMIERGIDESTHLLSLMFALLGLGCAALSCLVVPRTALRWVLPMLLFPLILITSASTLRIYQHFTVSDLVNMVSKSGFSAIDEAWVETRVNRLYCSGSIQNMCDHDTLSQAKEVFSTMQWPLNADEDVMVIQACARDLVIPGPASQGTGCRMCRQESVPDDTDDSNVVLKLIPPSPVTSRWCGEYLVHNRMWGDRTDSPYRHHRLELLENLEVMHANRVSSVRLMMVLNWFAFPALVALLWWYCHLPHELTRTP